MVISSASLWLIAGIALILSELLATSVIAVFFGLGALAVAAGLYLGIIASLTSQFWVFSLVSLACLLVARKKLKSIFVGASQGKQANNQIAQLNLGQRVKVLEDFTQGQGRVELNGAHWTATSQEPLAKGQVAYILNNDGILLHLSATPPNPAS